MRSILCLIIGLAGVVIAAAPVAAQDPVAEVRTWSGETLRLSQPSLEVFYTILVKGKEDGAIPRRVPFGGACDALRVGDGPGVGGGQSRIPCPGSARPRP